MPITPTYPGVYVEELPSGVHTITAVATSITAFVGRTARGAVNTPTAISSFADFQRLFGGLWANGPMTYAVCDFYLNGGSQALIVRLSKGAQATLRLKAGAGELDLLAASAGSWGSQLRARVDHLDASADAVAHSIDPSFTHADLFNLTVRDMATGATEQFLNLTGKDSRRRVDKVLKNESGLVLVGSTPAAPPNIFPVPDAHGSPPANKTVWQDDASSTGVATADAGTDGGALSASDFQGSADARTGIFALEKTDLFNLLCIPPDTRDGDTDPTVWAAALGYCAQRRAMLIVDPPSSWISGGRPNIDASSLGTLGLTGDAARNGAVYFPRVQEADPLMGGQMESFVPCGIVAGVMARTDASRGVWKAPAGLDASLNGTQGLDLLLNDQEDGRLNPLGINVLRSLPDAGRVVWGARTLRGADQLADEYKYIPVRRLALFIEESLFRGLQWVVFEPNDEPLWSQIRLNVGAFMHNLFRLGAFQGRTPQEAYLVKCDGETTTQNDIDLGVVNILVQFAPLKPAEFVVLQIQQKAGALQT